MIRKTSAHLLALFSVLALTGAPMSRAQYSVIHNFSGLQGKSPYGAVTVSGSTMYGSTYLSGSSNKGVVFSMEVSGSSFTVLHNFIGNPGDGSFPEWGSGVVVSGSQLFGTTAGGGSNNEGAIYRLNTDGTGYSLLHSFAAATDGTGYNGGLLLSGTTLYGMTQLAGPSGNEGTIYKIQTDGTGFSLLHDFTGSVNDGRNPWGGALTLSGAKLYGMTTYGGTDEGVIFSLNTDGTGFSLLHAFAAGGLAGRAPQGNLTLVGTKFYGLTSYGGSSDNGVLFSIEMDGSDYTVMHEFAGGVSDGARPYGSLTLLGSTLYGMTADGGGASNYGTLFSIDLDGSDYALVHAFGGVPGDGAKPFGDLTLSGNTLYGMTNDGGSTNAGTIFQLAVPEPSSALLLAGAGLGLLLWRRRG
jgi:uncharacterized repeat protein (TIGR03803 family)